MASLRTPALITILVFVGMNQAGRATAEPCAAAASMPFQIRPSNCQLAEAVTAGMARSETFHRLVDRIGELKGIVYVDGRHIVQPDTRQVLDGTLQHRMNKAGDFRLLYVTVAPGRGNINVALLAHELQHVTEVLESGVTTEAGITQLFERIGADTGARTFETVAAVAAQQAVARELARRR